MIFVGLQAERGRHVSALMLKWLMLLGQSYSLTKHIHIHPKHKHPRFNRSKWCCGDSDLVLFFSSGTTVYCGQLGAVEEDLALR
jgi:hypothetical protein